MSLYVFPRKSRKVLSDNLAQFHHFPDKKTEADLRSSRSPISWPTSLSVAFITSKTQGDPPGIGDVVSKREKVGLFPKGRREWSRDMVFVPRSFCGR